MDDILPAVGQGALGIEIHRENKFVDDVVQSIHHEDTYLAVIAERLFFEHLKAAARYL
jgi:hydroxymethylbilane synthase